MAKTKSFKWRVAALCPCPYCGRKWGTLLAEWYCYLPTGKIHGPYFKVEHWNRERRVYEDEHYIGRDPSLEALYSSILSEGYSRAVEHFSSTE